MRATARRGWIGADLGTHAVKLAQVELAADGLRLVEAVAVPRARPENVRARAMGSADSCGEEIRAAVELGKGFVGRKAACTLSMHWCQTRHLTVSTGTADDQICAIADKTCDPGTPGEQVSAFWKTGLQTKSAERYVEHAIGLAVPQRLAVQVTGDFARCGRDCQVLDALPFSLARAVGMVSGSGEPPTVAAVDWGFAETTFCTISGGMPTFVRRLRGCHFGEVLGQASLKLGLELDEVESLLLQGRCGPGERGRGAGHELHSSISELAAQPLRRTADELRRTLTFLENQLSMAVPQKVWLFGAGAIWSGAADLLSGAIGRPVEVWRLQHAGIRNVTDGALPDEILAAAVSLSTLAWTNS